MYFFCIDNKCLKNKQEWVWVYAYFVKAIIQMKKSDPDFKHEIIVSYLANHKNYIMQTE